LQTNEETKTIDVKNWKDYPLSLVNNTTDKRPDAFIKVLTPLLIQNNKHLPEKFPVYTKGKVEGVDITLIDENTNGQYNDIGTDVMIIGKSSYGIPVSKIISINNKLYECNVSSEGEKISLKPYEGKYGELDLISNFKCPTKLDLVILNSDDIYIDVTNNKKTVMPCGSYKLWLGFMQSGTSHVVIKQNAMKNIEITEDFENGSQKRKLTAIQWGGPFKIDFEPTVSDNKVTVSYASLRVYGSADEEYYNFTPIICPQVEIIDAKEQPAVIRSSFPGC
jgi:hypothetical protein